MSANTFLAICLKYNILPELVLEDKTVVLLLKVGASEKALELYIKNNF